MLYTCSKYTVMDTQQESKTASIKSFNPKQSITRAKNKRTSSPIWTIPVSGKRDIVWASKMERVAIIRKGLPYETIDVISKKADLPVKKILHLLGLAQTTYNKKKRENDLLGGQDSEVVLVLTELLEFGVEVFNHEKEKFQRWLKKPNVSLGGNTPISLFDSQTGIQEIRNALNRLEFGNMA